MTATSRSADARRNDAVIEAFRADIDVTLLEQNLALTVEERFSKLMELQGFARELRTAGKRAELA